MQSSPAATYQSTSKAQSSAAEALTKEQKTKNFANFMLDRYKAYGLTLSSGPMPENLDVAPSFSVAPKILEQTANDPKKAKELDDLLHGLTTIGTNLFHAINHPPAVKFCMSVHVNADGSQTVITRKEYSSLEAKNKYGGFDFNSFLDRQEELWNKYKSDFDYKEAIGEKLSEDYTEDIAQARREDRKWMQEVRDRLRMEEWRKDQNHEKDLLQQQQKKQFSDRRI